MPPPERLVIRPLRADDVKRSISLGGDAFTPLKTFLRRDASGFEERSLARTYVLVDAACKDCSGRVWGFVTLVASEVKLCKQVAPAGVKYTYDSLPAVKLARMAIDLEIQKQKWGRELLAWALGLVTQHVAAQVGCHLFVTDAKKESVGFYEKVGFTMLDTENNRSSETPIMFIHLPKLG